MKKIKTKQTKNYHFLALIKINTKQQPLKNMQTHHNHHHHHHN